MKRPIIGIAASIIVDQGGMFPGYRRSYVNEDYVLSVIENGGIPFILPISQDDSVIESYIEQIDGLLLTGGHDVCPFNYNEEPAQKLGDTFPIRDEFDFKLMKTSKEKRIPILGICRGCQIMNVFHGGSLWQDISYAEQPFLKHWQGHHLDLVTHSVLVSNDSRLHQIFSKDKLMVNSFHHQVIKQVAPEFNVVASAADGAVEAIEHETYPFMIGVQWHPEMLHQSAKDMNKLFTSFINQAGKTNQAVACMCEVS